ncbi:hypothetical protein [Methanosphaera sp. WGK6]|uniref:hypothetical protein n=1 Tax=Methanosphaera sp. WGK6 TaxID=1561964 RepID=UPI00084BC6DE|nr:hypothetical protein [Methanosphaera sp. WGK6]OED30647.1 hypothetical protein NL43_01520 [Methanosphaera sp. WGK6]
MVKYDNPYLFIGILILAVIASGLMCNIITANTHDTSSIMAENGTTVVSGDLLINTGTMRKVPLASNPENILRPLKNRDITTVLLSLMTGSAPKDVIKNNSYITANGHISSKLEGPGKIIMDDEGKILVKPADSMIWGYKLPYTVAIKSGDSISLVQNNTTIKTLSKSEINNDSIPTDYVTAAELQSWFDSASNGSEIAVDYYLGNFSDDRANVYGKENIIKNFGNDSYGYMRNYTSGAPVLVYEHNASEIEVSNSVSTVEYLSGYPTETRAANAKAFAAGWNNTVIPAHSSAHGKENASFTAIAESEAASGSATHGVCPPARSLRNALLELGCPIPVGMTTGDEAVLYGYRPTVDVLVTNNLDYPIKIVMWTTGSSGDTQIYTKIYKLTDNTTDITNSTNNTNSSSE